MKKNILLLTILLSASFQSCNDADDLPQGVNEYVIATPLTADLITFKEEAVEVTDPVPIVILVGVYFSRLYNRH